MIVDSTPPRSGLIVELERKHKRATPADTADFTLLRRALPRLPMHPDPRALALVVGHCGTAYASQDAGLLTACLWATRHRNATPVQSNWNLGRALRAAPQEHAQRIWEDLCAANDSGFARRMASAISVLTIYGVPTDWHRLHRDLRSWHQGFHHVVLRRWCTGLFGGWHESREAAQLAAEQVTSDQQVSRTRPEESATEHVNPSREESS